MLVYAVDHPELPPLTMPDRFRTDVAYFMTPAGEPGVPPLGPKEYFVRLADARKWAFDLVVEVVSPLDVRATAELELSDEQEAWLLWMVRNQIERIRIE